MSALEQLVSTPIREQIRTFICEQFEIPPDRPEFTDDAHLFESGLVDSMGVVELVLFLEENFHIHIDDAHFYTDRFTNLQGLTEIVSETLAAKNGE